jgi:hypothetical protein
VRVGCGAAWALELHWCLKESAFENVSSGFGTMGDGGYLFDPQGDLRAWQTYPCLVACSDPLAGRVRLAVQPSGSPEDGTLLERHLGRGRFVLADGTGVVSLRTADDVVTDCVEWGPTHPASCP